MPDALAIEPLLVNAVQAACPPGEHQDWSPGKEGERPGAEGRLRRIEAVLADPSLSVEEARAIVGRAEILLPEEILDTLGAGCDSVMWQPGQGRGRIGPCPKERETQDGARPRRGGAAPSSLLGRSSTPAVPRGTRSLFSPPTARAREVFFLPQEGLAMLRSTAEVALLLGMAPATFRAHMQSATVKPPRHRSGMRWFWTEAEIAAARRALAVPGRRRPRKVRP